MHSLLFRVTAISNSPRTRAESSRPSSRRSSSSRKNRRLLFMVCHAATPAHRRLVYGSPAAAPDVPRRVCLVYRARRSSPVSMRRQSRGYSLPLEAGPEARWPRIIQSAFGSRKSTRRRSGVCSRTSLRAGAPARRGTFRVCRCRRGEVRTGAALEGIERLDGTLFVPAAGLTFDRLGWDENEGRSMRSGRFPDVGREWRNASNGIIYYCTYIIAAHSLGVTLSSSREASVFGTGTGQYRAILRRGYRSPRARFGDNLHRRCPKRMNF
ncbi:hypothetical protein EDB85DRAFT_761892 [Lactarius pseudohatsudake]|nr:hypothetical protein EDB85DRAFT_761892 [Lactarius pseudohatsudake]